VSSSGALQQLPGFPVPTGGQGTLGFGFDDASDQLTYDAVKHRLYVINFGSNTLSAFSVSSVTGALTASGGSWNASIVAEVASWGDTKLKAAGLGSYIADASAAGDYPRVVLGVVVMSVMVVAVNRLVWRPLYRLAERRFRLD
jgi:hypothetical protein